MPYLIIGFFFYGPYVKFLCKYNLFVTKFDGKIDKSSRAQKRFSGVFMTSNSNMEELDSEGEDDYKKSVKKEEKAE